MSLAVGADLSQVRSVDQLVAALRAERSANPEGWLRGWGLDPPPDEFAESGAPLTVVAGTIAHRAEV